MSDTARRFNWIALVFAVGGLVLAGIYPEPVALGIPAGGWIALIGAGVIRPDMLRKPKP